MSKSVIVYTRAGGKIFETADAMNEITDPGVSSFEIGCLRSKFAVERIYHGFFRGTRRGILAEHEGRAIYTWNIDKQEIAATNVVDFFDEGEVRVQLVNKDR